jgi:hypothetical protein
MAVYRLFRNRPFDPETITMMTSAYADICRTLDLGEQDSRSADTVAKTVIEFAQRGERDPARLRRWVLQALRSRPDCAQAGPAAQA